MTVDTKAITDHPVLQACHALLEVVQESGRNGAPAGHMYAALCGVMSLDQFMRLMHLLEEAGKVEKRHHVYYAVN